MRLYPREFRREFGDDLVQAFTDLVERLGVLSAWRRTVVDLVVTVPRHRMETIMNPRHSSTAVLALAAAGAVAGVLLLASNVASTAALGLTLVSALVALAQRSRLARSMRPEKLRDRRRFGAQGAIAAVVAVSSLVIGMADLGDEEQWPAGRVIAYNVIFFAAAITAVASFVVALRRPRVA